MVERCPLSAYGCEHYQIRVQPKGGKHEVSLRLLFSEGMGGCLIVVLIVLRQIASSHVKTWIFLNARRLNRFIVPCTVLKSMWGHRS